MNKKIAIVGVTSILPGSNTTQGCWRNILGKKDFIKDIPDSHFLVEDYYDPELKEFSKIYCKKGAFLDRYPFDPLEYNIPPNTLSAMDTAQIYGLIAARKLLNSTKSFTSNKLDKKHISIIIGAAAGTEMIEQMAAKSQKPVWIKVLRETGLPESQVQKIAEDIINEYPSWTEDTFPGMLANVIAGRIANRLDLGGSNFVVDAACASSLSAMGEATRELIAGAADLVITGGVDAINTVLMFMCFSKTPALSKTGDIRPFSNQADGTILGEGTVLFALRRLEDAEKDGDDIYAVINSYGASSDGHRKSIYAPAAEGQSKAIKRAYDQTEYSMKDVELIEAHGTGTIPGDKAEFSGLILAMGEQGKKQTCALGTIKSQIGHTKSTAGAAGAFKCVMGLHHKILPPTIKVQQPSSEIDLPNSSFYLNMEPRPWIHSNQSLRKAGVSSFGFGGSNFHMALEEYPGTTKRYYNYQPGDELLFIYSSNSLEDLCEKINRYIRIRSSQNQETKEWELIEESRNSQINFNASENHRVSIISKESENNQKHIQKILSFIRDIESQPANPITVANSFYYRSGNPEGKLAFIFSGQGSQYLNMGRDLINQFSVAREPWDVLCDIPLRDNSVISDIVYPISVFSEEDKAKQAAKLNEIESIQPAIAALTLSHLCLLKSLNISPDCTAGHSFGELSALFYSGVIPSEEDFFLLARHRSELMNLVASQKKQGGMMAINASDHEVEKILKEMNSTLILANINSQKQVVISGEIDELEKAEHILQDRKIHFKRLSVPTAFHSPLADCSEEFSKVLNTFKFSKPKTPVYSNLTGEKYITSIQEIKTSLASQLKNQVQFKTEILNMYKEGVLTFVEVGPNKILSNFVKDTLDDPSVNVISIDGGPKVKSTDAFWRAMGMLSAIGIDIQYSNLWQDFWEYEKNPTSENMSKAHIMINGSNVGKPYPPKGGFAALPKPNPEKSKSEIVISETPPAGNLEMIKSIQASMHAAEEKFQNTIAESHMAYLKSTEQVLHSLIGQPSQTHSNAKAMFQTTEHSSPPIKPLELKQEVKPEEVVEIPESSKIDVKRIFLDIISEKTGYPVDMLDSNADLESGLGIDSIKRVEILSALQEQIPELAQVDTTQLAALNTIKEIQSFIEFSQGTSQNKAQEPLKSADNIDFKTILLEVVSDKTGYPVDMLDLNADLESGLGIDSIKRVEILSAFQERVPNLEKMDTTELTTLNSIGEIIQYANGLSSQDTPFSVPVSQNPAKQVEVKRYSIQYVEKKELGIGLTNLKADEPLSVIKDNLGIGEILVEHFNQAGIHCTLEETWSEKGNRLIYLKGLNKLTGSRQNKIQQAIEINKELFGIAQKQAKNNPNPKGLLVAVADLNSDIFSSYLGGLPALIKTASKEWEDVGLKAINVSKKKLLNENIAQMIFKEMITGGDDIEVVLEKGIRRIPVEVEESLIPEAKDNPLTENDVAVVSGGLKGVTAECLYELSKQTPLKLAIIGRSEIIPESELTKDAKSESELKNVLTQDSKKNNKKITPIQLNDQVNQILSTREIIKNREKLEENGCKVEYYPGDIGDYKAVSRILKDVRTKLGPIKGVIHGAGVLADKKIVDKTIQQFNRVFDTKVNGLIALLESTRKDELKFFICFSSIAARKGNVGQVDYAMANEILNKVCVAESGIRKNCLFKSINWGPWDGGMVTDHLKSYFLDMGIGLIPLKTGARFFSDEILGFQKKDVEIVVSDDSKEFAKTHRPKNKYIYDLWIHETTNPCLNSHIIKNTVVTPMVLATEWGVRIVKDIQDQETTSVNGTAYEVKDLKIIKGIMVEDLKNKGRWIQMEVDAKNGEYKVKCFNGKQIYYMYKITRLDKISPSEICIDKSEYKPWKMKEEEVYSAYLFHGKHFQVIAGLEGISENKSMVTFRNKENISKDGFNWKLDIAMIDGAVQASALWKIEKSNKDTLPTGFESLKIYKDTPYNPEMTYLMEVTDDQEFKMICDIKLLDQKKELVYEMKGLINQAAPNKHIYCKFFELM